MHPNVTGSVYILFSLLLDQVAITAPADRWGAAGTPGDCRRPIGFQPDRRRLSLEPCGSQIKGSVCSFVVGFSAVLPGRPFLLSPDTGTSPASGTTNWAASKTDCCRWRGRKKKKSKASLVSRSRHRPSETKFALQTSPYLGRRDLRRRSDKKPTESKAKLQFQCFLAIRGQQARMNNKQRKREFKLVRLARLDRANRASPQQTLHTHAINNSCTTNSH